MDKIKEAKKILTDFPETAGWFGDVLEEYSVVPFDGESHGLVGASLMLYEKEIKVKPEEPVGVIVSRLLHEGWHGMQFRESQLSKDSNLFYSELTLDVPKFSPQNVLKPYDFLLMHEIYAEMAAYAAQIDMGYRLYLHTGDEDFAAALEEDTGGLYGLYREVLQARDPLPVLQRNELAGLVDEDAKDEGFPGAPNSEERRALAKAVIAYQWFVGRKTPDGQLHRDFYMDRGLQKMARMSHFANINNTRHFNAISSGAVNFQPLTREDVRKMDGYSGPSIFTARGITDFMSPGFLSPLNPDKVRAYTEFIHEKLMIETPQAA